MKFKQTNSAKVLVKLFQKLVGCGATPHINPPTNFNLFIRDFYEQNATFGKAVDRGTGKFYNKYVIFEMR